MGPANHIRPSRRTSAPHRGRRGALIAYGVRRIVDLRWADERSIVTEQEPGVEVVHVPLFGDRNERHDADRELLDRISDHVEFRRISYLEHLGLYRTRFAGAVEAVATAPEGCVLVHCAGGVDRTGLVAALLLRVAGVSREDAATDYGLSEDSWAPLVSDWIAEAESERERAFRACLAAVPAEAMLGVLVELDRTFGGAEGYLRDAGLSGMHLQRARARLRA